MNFLWLTWKDRTNPLAGGAELVNEEIAKRLTKDGHTVHFLVGGYAGCKAEEQRDGFQITRLGNRFTVYWKAWRYYRKHRSEQIDLVIDECNTIPFFAKFYSKQPTIFFIHQLAREIWWYEMPFPFSLIGYLLEPLYLRLVHRSPAITVSRSTKHDLTRLGFDPKQISVISEGIETPPVSSLSDIQKSSKPTLLALGSLRSMKRTHHILHAFEIAKKSVPDLELIVAGDDTLRYGKRTKAKALSSSHSSSIKWLGRVSPSKRLELLQKSHLLAVTSVREGWGLVVTEAASQGTPSVVYDVPGLRDSVRGNETGVVTRQNTPECMAKEIVSLLEDAKRYGAYQKEGWKWSTVVTFDKCYEDFLGAVRQHCVTEEVNDSVLLTHAQRKTE